MFGRSVIPNRYEAATLRPEAIVGGCFCISSASKSSIKDVWSRLLTMKMVLAGLGTTSGMFPEFALRRAMSCVRGALLRCCAILRAVCPAG
jgi:hypothetical protein